MSGKYKNTSAIDDDDDDYDDDNDDDDNDDDDNDDDDNDDDDNFQGHDTRSEWIEQMELTVKIKGRDSKGLQN